MGPAQWRQRRWRNIMLKFKSDLYSAEQTRTVDLTEWLIAADEGDRQPTGAAAGAVTDAFRPSTDSSPPNEVNQQNGKRENLL